jgi:dihydrodipicolinate synthase/N-acetylneuraminate lyase
MITPLDEHENIDEAGVRKLVSRLIDRGVNGIFLLGSMGEFPMIVEEEKQRLVEIAVDEASGRVPVLANVSAEGSRKTERILNRTLEAGADMIVLVPPYFYNVRDEREIKNYYLSISRSINKPLIIYNIPVYTNNPISASMIEELAEEENIAGIKTDIIANLGLLRTLGGRDDFAILHGNESTIDYALQLGVDGVIPGISTLAVDKCVELYQKSQKGDYAGASSLQKELLEIQAGVFGPKALHWGTGHKHALSLLSLCQEHVATTLLPLNDGQKDGIAATLRKYGIS